jgi:hypothetical protein
LGGVAIDHLRSVVGLSAGIRVRCVDSDDIRRTLATKRPIGLGERRAATPDQERNRQNDPLHDPHLSFLP